MTSPNELAAQASLPGEPLTRARGTKSTRRRTAMVFTWLVTLLAAVVGFSTPVAAGHSGLPAYPVVAVTDPSGAAICDTIGDEAPVYVDVACSGGASAYIGSDGTTVTAGMVLTADPRETGNNAPFQGTIWLVELRSSSGALLASMGVDGKGEDILYVQCGGAKAPRYAVSAATALADGHITVVPDGSYFRLTFTIALAELAPCNVTASTPIRLVFGTSEANNTDTINKDSFVTAGVLPPPPIVFGGSLEMSKAAQVVSGPVIPVVGQTTTYDLVVTAGNPSAYALSDVIVTDTLPTNIVIQSLTTSAGTAAQAAPGSQTVNWSGFGLAAGTSRTLTIRVTLTPTGTDVGSPVLLNAGASGSATRVAGGGTLTDDSNSVSSAAVTGPGLAVTKSVLPATVGPGGQVTYTINLASTGTAAVDVGSVVDTLPAGFTLVANSTSGTLGAPASSGTVDGSNVTWTGPFVIPASSSRTLIFQAVASSTPGAYDNVAVANAAVLGAVSSGSTARVTVVPEADLAITKAESADPVVAGDNLTYTLVVSNAGPSTATGVTVTDPLPAGATFVPTGSSTGCSVVASTVTCPVPDLAPGARSADVTIVTALDPTLGAGNLSNTATVSATTSDPNPANNSATALTAVQAATADLSIVKSASLATAVAGQSLTYTLAVTNAGPSTAPSVSVTDVLPLGVTFTSAPAGCGYDGPSRTVTCSAASLANGAGITFDVVVMVDPARTSSLSNTAAVSSAIADPAPAGNISTVVTQVSARADLSVTVSDTPDPTTAGGTLAYTLTAANAGPSTATAVVVTDALPPEVTFVSAPGCTYDGPTHTVSCSVGTLAPAGSAPFTVSVLVGPAVTGSFDNTATVTGGVTDPTPADNSDTETTTVSVLADLVITKVADAATVIPGNDVTYTIGVTNNGPSTATAVQITDVLPAGLTFVSAPGCSYAAPTRTVTCTIPTIGVGSGLAVTRTVVATVGPGETSAITNIATVASAVSDPILPNTASAAVTLTPSADLVAGLSATPGPVTAGQVLSVVAGVTNTGPSTATGVVIATALPSDLVLDPANLPVGCTYSAAVVSCTVATLLSGGTRSFSFPATVAAGSPAGTLLPLGSAVSSPTFDPNLVDNTTTTDVTVQADNDLSVNLVDSPDPVVAGNLLTYTATVTNSGPSTATGVALTIVLPAGVTLAPASVPAGCTFDGPTRTISCPSGTMTTGTAPPVVAVVSVDPGTTGSLSATATVSATTPDSVPANNSATAVTTVTTSADVSLLKQAGPSPVSPGDQVTYTLTAANDGPSTATAVVIADVLPAAVGAPQTPLPAGCTYDAATHLLSCAVGTLAPAATAVRAVTVTVAAGTTTGFANTATVATSATDPDSADNIATAGVAVQAPVVVPPVPAPPSADLEVDISATPDPVTAGQALDVVIGVTNLGPDDAGSVVLSAVLPAGLTPGTLPTDCAFDTGTRAVRCTVASLPAVPGPGPRFAQSASGPGSASFAFFALVAPGTPAGTVLSLPASVLSAVFDPVGANNQGTAQVTVAAAAVVPPVTGPGPGTDTNPVATAAPAGTTPVGLSIVSAVAPAQVETQVLPSVLTSPARSSVLEIVGGPAAPSPAPAPTPAATVVTPPAAPAAAGGGTVALAVTGAPSLRMATWGLSLIGIGLVLRVGARRRREAAAPAPSPSRPRFVL